MLPVTYKIETKKQILKYLNDNLERISFNGETIKYRRETLEVEVETKSRGFLESLFGVKVNESVSLKVSDTSLEEAAEFIVSLEEDLSLRNQHHYI